MEVTRCRADQACAAITSEGSALTARPSTLCHACCSRLQEQLDQLPEILDVLQIFVRKSLVPQSGGARVSSSSEPAVPLNLHVLDLIDEVGSVLDRCDARIVDLITRPAVEFIICGHTVRYDGVDIALEVGRVWRKSDKAIGISRTWRRLAARCPECDLPTLGAFHGSDTVTCSSCAHSLTLNDYSILCLVQEK